MSGSTGLPGTDLTGKVALVTGGSRGIGLAIGHCLRESGARVVLTSRTSEAAAMAAEEVGGETLGYGAHAADSEAAAACVDFVLERFGSLDILINNAGTNPAFGALVDVDHARFAKTVEVNQWAPIMWSSIAWKRWMSEHGGAIVTTASLGAYVVGANLGVYHQTKAAVVHMTRHLALELAPTVRVNAIAPGVIRTRLAEGLWKENEAEVAAAIPLGRVGEPDDVAPLAVYLASDAARWITGETVVVDGGQALGNPAAEAAEITQR